ncbi:MAG: glutamate 5-kinase [Bacteroidales bacterium]|nr:glutamate 5-kinase [Clostridium sp.]MCM1204122.1 glutamate 5-kinase [Bacteroidales bacterium]
MDKQRIVVKVGTSTLTGENGAPNFRTIDKLAQVLSTLHNEGNQMILVSSGAIAVGVNKMRLPMKPEDVCMKQAAAAVGQCELMHIYDKCFGEYGNIVGQILLTAEDIAVKSKRRNLKNTFEALLENGMIPVVNENDSVSHAEIESEKKVFGDNDMLSAIVANLCEADRLIILSDIEGLYDSNPHENENAELLYRVSEITEEIRNLGFGSGSNRGTGGMATKLEAAEYAVNHGMDMHIAHGNDPENIYRIIEGEAVGTWFVRRY